MLWAVLLFILLQPSLFSKKKPRVNIPEVIMRSIAFAVVLYFLKLQGLEGFQQATAGQIPARFVNFLNSVAQAKRTEGFQDVVGSTGGTGAAGVIIAPSATPVASVAVTYPTCTTATDCAYSVSVMSTNTPQKPTEGCAPLNATTAMPNISDANLGVASGVFLYSSSQTLEMFDKSGKSIPFTAIDINSLIKEQGLTAAEIKALNIPTKYDTIAIALGKNIKALYLFALSANTSPGIKSDVLLSMVNKSASTMPTSIKLTPASFFTTPVLIGIGVGVVALLLLGVVLSNGSGSRAATS
jgi:hypothetical protein